MVLLTICNNEVPLVWHYHRHFHLVDGNQLTPHRHDRSDSETDKLGSLVGLSTEKERERGGREKDIGNYNK